MSGKKDKGYKDQDDLLREIREVEPDYVPPKIPLTYLHPSPIPFETFTPFAFESMKEETPASVEYILHPAISTQGICFIYAATGLGKTLFALNMAYAIAGGGEFLTYKSPLPRKVLYVDGEMPYAQLHERLMQIAKHQGELSVKGNLYVLTPDKFFPLRIPKIDDPHGQETYLHIIDKYQFDVIIFDNLSMLSTFDQNQSHEWVAIQDWFLSLRSMGKTLIVLHHSGKNKDGYRGTSRILDCADTAISLQPHAEETWEEENVNKKRFKVVYQKSRLFGGKDALPFEVTLENGIWSSHSISILDKIVECLNAKMTQRDIAKELATSQSTVHRLIKKARLTGRVTA